MNQDDAALCAATARLLQAGSVLAAWGLGLSVVALAMLVLTGHSPSSLARLGFVAVALAGVLERYLAFRVRFDAGLFHDVAHKTIASLDSLDRSLQQLKLRQLSGTSRELDERVAGARQLMQRHCFVVLCQSALFLLALLTKNWQ